MKILVPLAHGFEEIEAITVIDILRRANCEVITASLDEGPVTASRQTRHLADALLIEVLDETFDAIVLPGGQPGADTLMNHLKLREKLVHHAKEDRWLGAICAAPKVLEAAGLLKGKQFTCHPSAKSFITSGKFLDQRVVVDGKLITSQAAGSALPFALRLVGEFKGSDEVKKVNEGVLFF